MKKIAVIGSINVDYVAYVSRNPLVGETVLSSQFQIVPGGKGANQAVALGRMGANVAMFGAVGKDANASLGLNNIKNAGVDISHVLEVEGHTGVALITVESSGDNSIVVAQGANLAVTKEYIDDKLEVLMEYDIIAFQLEIPLETVIYTAGLLKAKGKTIVLDPAPAPGSLPEELLENVDFLKPNETELAILTDGAFGNDMESACRQLLKQGVGCVLASAGAQGVLVADRNEDCRFFPAEKVRAIDTTAAGDSFTAAFIYALARDCSMERAVCFAEKVAAIVVQRKGAQTSIPTRKEIEELYQS